jgi:hypothetical protein
MRTGLWWEYPMAREHLEIVGLERSIEICSRKDGKRIDSTRSRYGSMSSSSEQK